MNSIPARLRKLFSLPQLPIWLAPFILLAPVYLTGKAIFWGTPLLQFGPWWSYAWRTLLAGHLPLWNTLSGMGAPLLANYQSALFYPLNWIYLALYALAGVRLMAWGMALIAALHLVWAGVGMAAIVRRLGLGVLAQAVSGLAFGLSGYLVARLGFLSITSTVAWLPWVLVYLSPRLSEPLSLRRDYLKLTFCLAMLLLAGHAQTAWYTLLLAGLWAGFWAGFSSRDACRVTQKTPRHTWLTGLRRITSNWLWLGLALALAVGVCAAQLFPTVEYLAQSQRAAAVDYDYALNYSFWPWHLLGLLAPGIFGSPASGDYWGYANYWEDAIYTGLLPLLMAIGVLRGSLRRTQEAERRQRHLTWFLGGLMLLSLLLALGKNTPVFPWLYRHIPTFAMFQAPARWLIWSEFALALLAGMGVERWRRPQGWGLYWTRMWTMGAFAIMVGAGLAWLYLGAISPSFIRATALVGFFGVGIGVLSQTAPPDEDREPASVPAASVQEGRSSLRQRLFQFAPPKSRPDDPNKPYRLGNWQWAVVIFLSLDLLVAGWGLNPGATPELYAASPVVSWIDGLAHGERLYLPKYQEDWLKYVRFLRFDTFDSGEDWQNLRAVLLPNTTLLDDIASTNNFDPLLPGRYADWQEMLEQASPASRDQMLRLMGVGVVESLNRREAYGVQYRRFDGRRARWIDCARLAGDPAQARSLVLEGGLDLEHMVVLEGLSDLPAEDCQEAVSATEPQVFDQPAIQAAGMNPNRIEIQSVGETAAWLVLSDVWYPGWQARVDGQPVPLLRANYLFQALRVPAGEHQIVLAYRPLSFWGGAALSLISLLAAGFIFFRMRRPAKNQDMTRSEEEWADDPQASR
jgi:Bacterial membrane protein YfhO